MCKKEGCGNFAGDDGLCNACRKEATGTASIDTSANTTRVEGMLHKLEVHVETTNPPNVTFEHSVVTYGDLQVCVCGSGWARLGDGDFVDADKNDIVARTIVFLRNNQYVCNCGNC